MPRRIPDYPTFYWGWNKIATWGSLISIIATLFFLHTVYSLLVNDTFLFKSNHRYPFMTYNSVFKSTWVLRLFTYVRLFNLKSRIVCISFIGILYDLPWPYQVSFQDPATNNMEGIIDLHHEIMFFLIVVVVLVMWLLYVLFKTHVVEWLPPVSNQNIYKEPFKNSNLMRTTLFPQHNRRLEIAWTIMPCVILGFIAFPSFALLFALEDYSGVSELTIHIIGNQWYWNYEATHLFLRQNPNDFSYVNQKAVWSSYLNNENPDFRLLQPLKDLILPVDTNIRLLITSTDVLHSWAVPSLGIKVDACPGRLNQVNLRIKRIGTFYGQCSEICGILHGFMPIAVTSIDLNMWVSDKDLSYHLWYFNNFCECPSDIEELLEVEESRCVIGV